MKIIIWGFCYIICFVVLGAFWLSIAIPVRFMGKKTYNKIGNSILSIPEELTLKYY